MTKMIGPDRVLTGACGKYAEPSGSLMPEGTLERILAGAPEASADGGEDECDGADR